MDGRIGCVCVLVFGLFAQAAEPERAVVENAYLRMVFSSTPVPALRERTHKTSGMNLLASATAPLFAVQVAQTNGASSWVESQQAKQGTVAISPVTGGKRIRLAFEGLGASADLRVELDGVLADTEPFVRADIDLYRAGSEACATLCRGVALPQQHTLELAPLEAAFVVLRPAK